MVFNPKEYYRSMFNNAALTTLEGLQRWNVDEISESFDEIRVTALFDAAFESPQVLESDGDDQCVFIIPNDTFERLHNNGRRLNSWHVEEAGEQFEQILDLAAEGKIQSIVDDCSVVLISQSDLNALIAKAENPVPSGPGC